MPAFVRKASWTERVQAYLNPYDFILWLSEEIETHDWDDKAIAYTLGPILHIIFLVARSNASTLTHASDDVFGDARSGTGWFAWFCSVVVTLLSLASNANALYTFLRKRHYRLFEKSVDVAPSTPSAQRVKVESSPASPLNFLRNIVAGESAVSRAHSDATTDVWELAVWDPSPVCLQLFCLFSPGHVFVYWLFLPFTTSDSHPSKTLLIVLCLELLLTAQLLFFHSSYTQQTKDMAIIKREVLNEYDTKFVHPRLQPRPSRDVGTQFTSSLSQTDSEVDNEVVTYRPITNLRRTFKTNPNPNYAKHVSPDNPDLVPKRDSTVINPFLTPVQIHAHRNNTPLRTAISSIQQPNFRPAMNNMSHITKNSGHLLQSPSTTSTGFQSDGGSLGIYSHTRSPLKKATSMYDLEGTRHSTPSNSLQAAAREISENRIANNLRSPSPVKDIGSRRFTSYISGSNAHTRY